MRRNIYKKLDMILTLDPLTSDKDRFSAVYTVAKALYAIAIETDNELEMANKKLKEVERRLKKLEMRNRIGKSME